METPQKVLRNKHLENIKNITTPIKIPPSPLLKQLGYGTGANVYQLYRSPRASVQRSPWAVKRLSSRNAFLPDKENVYQTRLREEAEILRKLKHPNIVGFRAFKTGEGKDTLAMEYCHTSLGDILETRNDNLLGPLPANLILKLCVDVLNGLEYLHTEAKLLHGDLKSYNVLIKGDFEICKLCDFGVSLPLDENGVIDLKNNPDIKYVGTDLWSAPEVLNEADMISDKADIFSFGLVVYETIALVPPHTLAIECLDTSTESENSLNLAYGTRPPLPENFKVSAEYFQILEIFHICTNALAEDRPSAKNLVHALNK